MLELRVRGTSDLRLDIERHGPTQAAAERLGVTPSRVSDFVRGRRRKFSLETPIAFEARLGRKVTVRLAA